MLRFLPLFFFFFNDTATTEIYTLSLHDALPISRPRCWVPRRESRRARRSSSTRCASAWPRRSLGCRDRKSTRLNSSHSQISYAVFCLKKKTIQLPPSTSQCHCMLPSRLLRHSEH